MNAKLTNPACKALYERLKANGKTGKQALIAVMNKLLKQVFAVAKTELYINQITVHKNLNIYLVLCTVHVVRRTSLLSQPEFLSGSTKVAINCGALQNGVQP
jgi:hypothetical protein